MPRQFSLSLSALDHEFVMSYADLAELVLDVKNWNLIPDEYLANIDTAVRKLSGALE